MASNESLKLHWKRSCWVMHLWGQDDINNMQLEPLTNYGWALSNGKLDIKWVTEQNLQAIKDRMFGLTKGCTCVTGCATRKCSCFKKGNTCGVGCNCKNCCNVAASGTFEDPQTEERHPTDSFQTNSQSALWDLSVDEEKDTIRLDDVEDIMDFVF